MNTLHALVRMNSVFWRLHQWQRHVWIRAMAQISRPKRQFYFCIWIGEFNDQYLEAISGAFQAFLKITTRIKKRLIVIDLMQTCSITSEKANMYKAALYFKAINVFPILIKLAEHCQECFCCFSGETDVYAEFPGTSSSSDRVFCSIFLNFGQCD